MLREALVSLVAEQGFDALKVGDITRRAMINRATFYRHYRDKYDLLTHCMDDVLDELLLQISATHTTTGELDHSAPLTNLETLFTHVGEHAHFYRLMLGKDGAGAFTSRLRDYLKQVMTERWRQVAGDATVPLLLPDLTISFLASAYIGVIVWWVNNDCPGSVQVMAQHMLTLTIQGPYRAFGLQPPE